MTEPHPLFPLEADDDDQPEVGWIHVTRFEGGAQKWARRLFAAGELTDLAELGELYGGGHYELIARSRDKRTITARRRYTLDGRPRPLVDGEDDVPRAGVPQPAPVAQGDGNQALLLAVLQMMQQQSAQTTQLLVAVLNRGDAASKEHITTMAALHDRFAQSQGQLMVSLLEAAKGGGGGEGGALDAFLKGMEMANEYRQGIAEGGSAEQEDGASDLAVIMEGFKHFAGMSHAERQQQIEFMREKRRAAEMEQRRPHPSEGGPPPQPEAPPS